MDSKFPMVDELDALLITILIRYMDFLDKFIDQLDRRVLQGKQIPHEEKLFSIFEEYTEWITKGKLHPNVELGKKLSITTDQYNLIVDYRVMEGIRQTNYTALGDFRSTPIDPDFEEGD